MPSTNRDNSVAADSISASDPADLSSTHHSLSRAVHARRDEFVRPHRIRIKVGSWNVAGCPGTDKDLASWFIDGQGLEPRLDSRLADLHLSEDSLSRPTTPKGENIPRAGADGDGAATPHAPASSQSDAPSTSNASAHTTDSPDPVRLPGGDKIGLYVLGLQEVVSLNLVHQSFYSDPSSIAKWQDAIEAALPPGYVRVASQQLIGLLLLIYASPEVASTLSNESTVNVGTGALGYMGNKGSVASRLVLGETTRLVFANCHLASGHDQSSLDRRCWDYNKIMTQTKFSPIENSGVIEEDGEKIGEEDFLFCLGDLNFRVDGPSGDDIRRILTLHTRGEYDVTKKSSSKSWTSEDGIIVLRDSGDGNSGNGTPGMVSRESSFDDEAIDYDAELPDPDDFAPDPHDDPASLQATLDSLLPHDQLGRMIKERKAFHQGWREGPITFLPTYKYDIGTVGLFDSSEKKRAPSWCDRILYRTRRDLEEYETKCAEEIEAKKKDDEMKERGIDQAADDESVLFDYDPNNDSSTDNVASGDGVYEYDEYDDAEEEAQDVTTKENFTDRIQLDVYTSHQRIMSSDHKPLVAIFTLNYDAVVPELKAKVHAEVARELDRAENEGRPGITVIVDGKDSNGKHEGFDGSGGIDFGNASFMKREYRTLTIANTGRVSATFSFAEKPTAPATEGSSPDWFSIQFVRPPEADERDDSEPLGKEITLEPGETVNAIIQVYVESLAHARLLNEGATRMEDVLILRVTDGKDHFIPLRAAWLPSCFGRSLEELIRIPKGGIRSLCKSQEIHGSIPSDLEVHQSSPAEIYKLTEAIESLTERLLADENMLDDCHVPRDRPGWPFDEWSWQALRGSADHEGRRAAIIEALDTDRPILGVLGADVPSMERLELVSEALLLFLRSMTDGIITSPLWAKIEQTIPSIGSATTVTTPSGAPSSPLTSPLSPVPAPIEDAKTDVLDILSAAPYHNIAFVFLTSMLAKAASDLLPLASKDDLKALLNGGRVPGRRQSRVGMPAAVLSRGLSFRRSISAAATGNAGGAPAVDEAAVQRRLAWERKAAEIIGVAICRTGSNQGPSGTAAAATAKSKEKKALEDRMRGVVEVFLRRDTGN